MEALGAQHAELDATLAELDEAAWGLPSRCAGWTVGDVVLHLPQTDELVVAN
ncbi:MAG: maleylpyruvate isomerase N-terminal domain-containing protein, partial [Actinomycetota bacterium]|nr:maleylpyruvate isomerase N-terminal domain-containing protein [Actinomycetota bacterium]